MSEDRKRAELQAAIELVRAEGLKVTKPRVVQKRSFEIDASICEKFYELKDALGMSVYDAINDALGEWIEKKAGIKINRDEP